MEIQIVETPLRFHLHGVAGPVPNACYGEVGLKLMDQMWRIVKETRTANSGINHWVYFPDDRMFVGVELSPGSTPPAGLEPLEFELPRCLRHLHIGPYQALPAKWQALKGELAARGETAAGLSLEVYGHHCDDPAQAETTILIGLSPRRA